MQYQQYRSKITLLQRQDAALELNILKSRYELFTTYDPLVSNLNKQKEIQQQLQEIPDFIDAQGKKEIRAILADRLTLLEQKESLSEWFKSQNALLKNSLHYLPLLISQLGEVNEISSISQSQNIASSNQNNLVEEQEWFYPLKLALNDLLRNVLLYNATNNNNLVPIIREQLVKIDQINDDYSIGEEEFPIGLVRSHTNLILDQKPEVEILTKQISSPLTKQQQDLVAIYDQYYQKAIRAGNFYRILTGITLLLIIIAINYLIVNRIMQINPKLKSYQKIVEQIIDRVIEINRNETDVSKMQILHVEQDDLNQLSEEIEIVAQTLQVKEQQLQAKQEIQENLIREKEVTSVNQNEESFSFLTARLLLITKNRQKILDHKMHQSLESVISQRLENMESQLIEFQGEIDRVQIIFSYPPQIQLSQVVTALKDVSRELICQDLGEFSEGQLWSDAYFIASCGGLNSNISEQLSINV